MAVAAIFTAYTAGAQVETQSATTDLSVEWTKVEAAENNSDNQLMLSGDSYINFTVIDNSPKKVKFEDETDSTDNMAIRYIATIEVRGADGTVKAGPVYYRCVRDSIGNTTFQYSTTRTASTISVYNSYEETNQSFSKYIKFVDSNPSVYVLAGNYYSTYYYGNMYPNLYYFDNNQNQIYSYNWNTATSGKTIEGTLHVSNGEDGDYMYMLIGDDNSNDNPNFETVVIGSTDAPSQFTRRGYDYTGYYYYNSNNLYYYLVEPSDGYSTEVNFSKLSSTTTRYDIYDDKPLWNQSGETTATDAASILSNRMNAKSHSDEISVYVHRKLVSGSWSTLCLPFDIKMSDLQNDNALGHNVKISEFQNVDVANGIVNFKSITDNTTTLKAGKPYLFYYQGENKDAFFAPNVKFDYTAADKQTTLTALSNRKSTTTSNGYYYTGVLEPLTNDATVTTEQLDGGCIVYIAAPAEGSTEQHLKKLKEGGKIKAFRAYLYYPKSDATNAAQGKGIISIDSELNDPTAITKVMVDGKQVSNRIYNLQGQCVGTEPGQLPAGVYVRNGKKFVVK